MSAKYVWLLSWEYWQLQKIRIYTFQRHSWYLSHTMLGVSRIYFLDFGLITSSCPDCRIGLGYYSGGWRWWCGMFFVFLEKRNVEVFWLTIKFQARLRKFLAVGHQVAKVYCWWIGLVAFPCQEWIQCYLMPLNSFWRKMNRSTEILHFKGYFEETYCWQLTKPISENLPRQTIFQEYSSNRA